MRLWKACPGILAEWRFALGWANLAFIAAALVLAPQGVARSIGLDDRSLLVIGRACIPFLAILQAPRLLLREVIAGTTELVATSRRGLARVWLSRLTIWVTSVWLAALLFLVPVEARAVVRHGFALEVLSSLGDVVVFSAFGTAAAYWTASETAGVLGGLSLWLGGVLAGIGPFSVPWLRSVSPLSVYVFGPASALVFNRLAWVAASVAVGIWLGRSLGQPQRLLHSRE